MKMIVESDHVDTRHGEKNGRPWTMRSQNIRVMSEYVRGVSNITLGDDQAPYPVGEYDIDLEQSISIGAYGRLELARNLVIRSVKASAALNIARTGTVG